MRFRRFTRWACTLAAALLAAGAMTTGWHCLGFNRLIWLADEGEGTYVHEGVWLRAGCLEVWIPRPNTEVVSRDSPELTHYPMDPASWSLKFELRRETLHDVLIVPLWAPFLLAAIPAALLWRADLRDRRRRKAGACLSCGYDRRGLDSAPCPECGHAITYAAPDP